MEGLRRNPLESSSRRPVPMPPSEVIMNASDEVIEKLLTRNTALDVAESEFPVGDMVAYLRDSESNPGTMVKEKWKVIGHELDEDDKAYVVISGEGRENKKIPFDELQTMNNLVVIDRSKNKKLN